MSERPEGESPVLRWRCLTGRVWKVICRDVLQTFIFRRVVVSFSTMLCKNRAKTVTKHWHHSRWQTVLLIHFVQRVRVQSNISSVGEAILKTIVKLLLKQLKELFTGITATISSPSCCSKYFKSWWEKLLYNHWWTC